MLPFLEPKNMSSIIIAKRKHDGAIKDDHIDGEEDQSLIVAAEDLIRAIEGKNATALAAAIKSAFEICDAMPHEEGPHTQEGEE